MNNSWKHCWLLLLTCSYHLCFAQLLPEDTTTNKPFFAAKKFDSKCFVGVEMTVTQILKKNAAMNLGLSLNWVVNHKYVISAKYHGLTTPVNIQRVVRPDFPNDSISVKHHFAGLGFSYILFHDKKFSFQPELTVGWGVVKYTLSNTNFRKDFAVIIPAVYGVYNAHKYFRLGVGLNYRITAGGSINGLKDSDLSGVGGVVFFRVGTF